MKSLATLLAAASSLAAAVSAQDLAPGNHSDALSVRVVSEGRDTERGSRAPAVATLAASLGVEPEALPPVEWIDYDGDGDLDALVRTSHRIALYRDIGGHFAEVQLNVDADFLDDPVTSSEFRVASKSCALRIEDLSGGAPFLQASSVPSTGRLFPISNDWFIDATTGYMGVGTTNPTAAVDVNGEVYARSGGFEFPDFTLQTTATIPGPAGLQGPAGQAADTGPDGDAGETGAQGPSGPTGDLGPVGSTGPAGEEGLTGFPGSPGSNGVNGPGLSAVQKYVVGPGDWIAQSNTSRVRTANPLAGGGTHIATLSGESLLGRVDLPNGAKITGYRAYGRSLKSSDEYELSFVRTNISSPATEFKAEETISGALGTFDISATLDLTIFTSVSNSGNTYYFRARPTFSSGTFWTSSGPFSMRSVVIDYTMP